MSVIVMGMDMPDCCEKCPFLDYEQGYCFASGKKQKDGWYDCNLYVSDNEKRHKDCPIRPLPKKHGRLIDADEATRGSLARTGKRLLAIDTALTIVEAEGE